jgi:hypothetical protein
VFGPLLWHQTLPLLDQETELSVSTKYYVVMEGGWRRHHTILPLVLVKENRQLMIVHDDSWKGIHRSFRVGPQIVYVDVHFDNFG